MKAKGQKKVTHYLIIYLMLSYQGAMIMNFLGADIFYGLCLGIGVLFIVFKKKWVVEKNKALYISVLTVMLFLTSVYTGGKLSAGTCLAIISRYLIVYTAINYDAERFYERFHNLVCTLSVISLIQFFAFFIFGANTFSPLYTRLYYNSGSYGLLFVRVVQHQLGRNCGIFGEPGQYQIVISTAMFLLLALEKQIEKKKKIIYLIIYTITLITIQSAAGFISLIIIYMFILLSRKENIPKVVRYIALLLGIITIIYIQKASVNSFVYTNFLNKVSTNGETLSFDGNSGAARVDSVTQVLELIEETPKSIWGIGFEGIVENNIDACAGLAVLLLMIGLPTFIVTMSGLIIELIKNSRTKLRIVFTIVLILNFSLSQPNILPILIILLCWATDKVNKEGHS